MQKYDILGKIGEGAYGVVLKCRCNENREVVAIKKFKETEDDEAVKKTTMRQVKILKMLRNENVVELKEAFRKKGIVYLVFEYVPNNLLEVLERSPDGLDPDLIKIVIYQLLKGLVYLHSLNIVHRDIKPQNLLIGDKNELKICDFGFARLLRKQEESLTDYVATRWYRPPELLVSAPYSKPIDIWAVGCILGELIDGNPMFPGENELDQLFLIQKCLGPLTADHEEVFLKNPRFVGTRMPDIATLETIDKRYLGKASPKALHFLKQTLKMNPAERLTAIDALRHPYFDGLHDEDQMRKLASNHDIKLMHKEEYPSSVSHQRKKYGAYHMPMHSLNQRHPPRQKTEQSSYADNSNKNGKISVLKREKLSTKEDLHDMKHSDNKFNEAKHTETKYNESKRTDNKTNKSNVQSKSVNKTNKAVSRTHEKNISLDKAHREVLTKTQTGFYIMGGAGVIYERDEEEANSTHYSRNKIYNVRSPKSKGGQRKGNNLPLNTQEVAKEDEGWQSSAQLPLLMVGSQQRQNKSKPMNIIITNSTFNYKSHH